jgi:hypothetical protein
MKYKILAMINKIIEIDIPENCIDENGTINIDTGSLKELIFNALNDQNCELEDWDFYD